MSKMYNTLNSEEKKESNSESLISKGGGLSGLLVQPKPVNEWYLRLDDNSIYGPVPLSDIKGWAAECRLGPDHEVSTDKKKWIPARNIHALQMEWMITLVDGTEYGPINKLALQYLLNDGVVAVDANIVNRITGEIITIDGLQNHEQGITDEITRRIPPKTVSTQIKQLLGRH